MRKCVQNKREKGINRDGEREKDRERMFTVNLCDVLMETWTGTTAKYEQSHSLNLIMAGRPIRTSND